MQRNIKITSDGFSQYAEVMFGDPNLRVELVAHDKKDCFALHVYDASLNKTALSLILGFENMLAVEELMLMLRHVSVAYEEYTMLRNKTTSNID